MMISNSDRISVENYGNTYSERGAYTSMFMDDFYDIVPIYGPKYQEINCYLQPENKEFEKSLYTILPSYQRRNSANFNDIILEAIKLIANHLTHKGYVIFEFVTLIDKNDEKIYKLNTVLSTELKLKKDNVIQVLHPNVSEQLNSSSFIPIPKNKCYVIEFPSSLGGRKKYQKFLKDFKTIENESPNESCVLTNRRKGNSEVVTLGLLQPCRHQSNCKSGRFAGTIIFAFTLQQGHKNYCYRSKLQGTPKQ